MNMIEKMARAIAKANGENPEAKTGSLVDEGRLIWQDYVSHARAALEAVRELTPEMTDMHPPFVQKREFLASYQAMIDAALAR